MSAQKQDKKECYWYKCRKHVDLKLCSTCRYALYCSRECQISDREIHKRYCNQMKEDRYNERYPELNLRDTSIWCYRRDMQYIPNIVILMNKIMLDENLKDNTEESVTPKLFALVFILEHSIICPPVSPLGAFCIEMNTMTLINEFSKTVLRISGSTSDDMMKSKECMLYMQYIRSTYASQIAESLKYTTYQQKIRDTIEQMKDIHTDMKQNMKV